MPVVANTPEVAAAVLEMAKEFVKEEITGFQSLEVDYDPDNDLLISASGVIDTEDGAFEFEYDEDNWTHKPQGQETEDDE